MCSTNIISPPKQNFFLLLRLRPRSHQFIPVNVLVSNVLELFRGVLPCQQIGEEGFHYGIGTQSSHLRLKMILLDK